MQYDKNNVFARIIRGEEPCDKIYEDDKLIAFNNLYPDAPIHVLVIPKGEYRSFDDFIYYANNDNEIVHFFTKVRQIAHDLGLSETGYRLITNHGDDAGQTVHHYHVHILGKKKLGDLVSDKV